MGEPAPGATGTESGHGAVCVWVQEAAPGWFGVAWHDARLVATAYGHDRDGTSRSIRHCIPRGLPFRFVEEGDEYARSVVRMLARLEVGDETDKRFELCPDCLSEPLREVLRAAAAIPPGYVSSYGNIASVASTEARVVGRVMATNPLYPIVPCHRVVGADFSLVGYTGRQDAAALRAKLDRLRAEARGATREALIEAAGNLRVYPVEWAITKAAREGTDPGIQLSLW